MDISKIKHGTNSTYTTYGCRCDECKRAATAYHAGLRERKRAAITPDDPRHGTGGFYTNHGCRCDDCREAVRQAGADRRAAFAQAMAGQDACAGFAD